jgi:pimeloyl-ACP methyl ester carboxylesterase
MESTAKRWEKRGLKGLALVILLVTVVGLIYEQVGRWQDRRNPPRVGLPVDIGGRSLNLNCSGNGSPAVILEAGANAGGYGWVLVPPGIAEVTRVCWYDRTGEGWSDPPSTPRTSTTVVNDLHEVLCKAGIPPPYILVGASIGGSYVRVYTARYPREVAGVVLVDSGHPDMMEPPSMKGPFNRMSPSRRKFMCAAIPVAGRLGILRLILHSAPHFVQPELNAEERRISLALARQPKMMEADTAQV